jgi:hypothetical protein
MTTQHTPTPKPLLPLREDCTTDYVITDALGRYFAQVSPTKLGMLEKRAFIMRACNAYEKLVEVLEKIKGGHSTDPQLDAIRALAAIAKAEGK